MEDYDELLKEHSNLINKHVNLVLFLNSDKSNEINSQHLTLLKMQENAMLLYSRCLAERIELFKKNII